MGMTKTLDALDKLQTTNPDAHSLLVIYWEKAMSGKVSSQELNEMILKDKIQWLKTEETAADIDKVLENIKLLNAVQ